MTYRVDYTETFLSQLDAQATYFASRNVSRERIDDWFARLFALTDSLNDWPFRCPIAEQESAAWGIEIRKMNYGDYLIFYRVDEDRGVVELLRFRHGAKEQG